MCAKLLIMRMNPTVILLGKFLFSGTIAILGKVVGQQNLLLNIIDNINKTVYVR